MKKFIRIALTGILACSVMFGCGACEQVRGSNSPPNTDDPPNKVPTEITAEQELNYTDGAVNFYNPDQGFYVPLPVKVTQNGISYNKSVVGDENLYHLRMDISAFSQNAGGTTEPITKAALDGIKELLQDLRRRDKNAVIRFCYAPNFGDTANCEPSLGDMTEHVKQLAVVLNEFPATLTAWEVGMVGPWGEMHTSEIVKDPATINTLIDTFLENTTEIAVLVRTPKMIYNYVNLPKHSDIYRLGLFNDGYLGSDTDLGTYENRDYDVAFVAKQSEHLPFGGEVTVPSCGLHDIEICLPEMYQIHLSYLNEQWNNEVVAKWKNTFVTKDCASADPLYYGKTAYEYIQSHMGYRFVLKNSTFKHTNKYDSLNVALTPENTGFGNLNKTKKAELLFVNEGGAIAHKKSVENFRGESSLNYSLPLNLTKGKYEVYLRLYGDEIGGTALYCLRFANDGIYDSSLQANRIGKIEIA